MRLLEITSVQFIFAAFFRVLSTIKTDRLEERSVYTVVIQERFSQRNSGLSHKPVNMYLQF